MTVQSATTLNLASIIEQHAAKRPERDAVICGGVRLTFRDLDRAANRLANGLLARGVTAGDHVALTAPNVPAFVTSYFAILKLGAVVVPLNVLFKPREIAYHLRDCDARAFLCFDPGPSLPLIDMAKAAVEVVPSCAHFVTMPASAEVRRDVEGSIGLDALIEGQPDTFETHRTLPDDTAVMLYTSGTTGQPKGAELSHMNMVFNAMVARLLVTAVLDNSTEGRNASLVTLPLFHSTGQSAQMNATLFGGDPIVLLPRFDPAATIETMHRERIAHWVGVPTMYWSLLQYARENHVDTSGIAKHLRVACSGGAPMPVAVMTEFEKTFGVRVLEGYGLSETSPVAAFNHLDRPSRPGTVGQPLFGVEIRCVDDSDLPVKPGERGEVVIRGHNIMKGYYKRPDATAEAMRNGWFHTGDIGVFDEDGYLAIVDRKKDMILHGGFNVYPRELEEVIMTHPAVSLVAVVGVPDPKYGEEVKAFVVKRPGVEVSEEELLNWCGTQFASYKTPRMIEFRETLPISPTGKILKRELRQETA
ncbi:MAG: long-chain fatty acid--CoA ligase [Acidobacteria bacterium]|nr:long-chain fatty acid--CoA ligase [Acidobacteriota bacterium]